MRKKLLFALIPAIILVICLLVGLELWLRSQHISWDPHGADAGPRAHQQCYRPAVTTGYEAIPNECERDEDGYYRSWEGEQPENAYSLLVFGDSIADQNRWVQETTRTLKNTWNSSVISRNAGTPGFDTCSELQLFKEKASHIDADALLLQFCPNDLAVTATVLPLPENKARVYIGWEYAEFPAWILRSRLATYIALRFVQRQGGEKGVRSSSAPIIKCLEQFKEITAERNMKFQVALFPPFVDDYEDLSPLVFMREGQLSAEKAEEMSRKVLNEAGIEFFEVRDSFQKRGVSLVEHRNHPNDVWHPNNDAQDFIGKDIGKYLVEKLK